MPEQLVKKLKKSILPEWKACFTFALFMGFIAHFYKITNWLPNWDSLVFRYDSQNMIAIGRWFLPAICGVSSFYDLPWVTGILAIVFHALGAVCIVKMLGVKKKITATLIGALVATFPTVASVMMYNYVADGYAFAFFLSSLAAVLLTQKKPRYIASCVLIAFSAGIYQAYITVTIMLLLIFMMCELLDKNADFKTSILKSVRYLLTGALGMALYYLILTLILKITGTELLQYQGIDSAVSLKGLDLLGALYIVKQSFMLYFFDFSNGASPFSVLNIIIIALTLVLYLCDTIKNKLKFPEFVLLCFYAVLLPIGASVLAFINSGIDYHNLMKMGFLVFYLFFLIQYEKTDLKNKKFAALKAWSIFIVATVLIFNYVLIANISYHKLNMAYEKSYAQLIRIADRIEQTDGAQECDSILVLGHLEGSEAYSVNLPPDMTGTTDSYILKADDEIVGQSVLCSALNDYCGKNYSFVYGKEKEALLEKAEDMGIWPDKNSVSVIEDVIVIKLGD